MKVVTNNVPRQLFSAHELTDEIREKYFEYIEEGEWLEDCHNRFFNYRDYWYDTQEFTVADKSTGWDAAQTDTFFSATVIKYVDDFERVIVGRVYT